MHSKADALAILAEAVPAPTGRETVSLGDCMGRVLAEDVTSDIDMPPFDRSAMDGYAVRGADVADAPVTLEVLEVIAAGTVGKHTVGPGQCSKIMTGAPVPDGADAVVMVEWTEAQGDDRVAINRGVTAGTNVAPRAQDMGVGEVVLRAGTPLRALELGVLASVGRAEVAVWRRPSVAVIATGDELIAPGTGLPGPGQIRETNGEMLAAQVASLGLGIDVTYLGIARDERADLEAKLDEAFGRDVVILSGGVSMGDYDIVGVVLKDRGLEVALEKVAIKPGKPLLFGHLEHDGARRYVFGLPGNPVSSFCTFELFVRPFLRGMMGRSGPHTLSLTARVGAPLGGKAIPRTQHLPARLVRAADGALEVTGVAWHGSGDLRGMLDANAFIVVEAGEVPPSEGSEVEVVPFEPDVLRLPPFLSRGEA